LNGFGPQCQGIARNGDFSRPFDSRQAAIQGRDELLEIARDITAFHRHGCPPRLADSRRAAFQTSPQPAHRQYAFSSGLRAVVEISADRHDGHRVGATGAAGNDGFAGPLPKLYEVTKNLVFDEAGGSVRAGGLRKGSSFYHVALPRE
jgi:hypothetical protein